VRTSGTGRSSPRDAAPVSVDGPVRSSRVGGTSGGVSGGGIPTGSESGSPRASSGVTPAAVRGA
jgi:hypothetical protein